MAYVTLKDKLIESGLFIQLKRLAFAFTLLSAFLWGIGLFRILTTNAGHKISGREGLEALIAAFLVISPSFRKSDQPNIIFNALTGYLTTFFGFVLIQISLGSSLLASFGQFASTTQSNSIPLVLIPAILGSVLLSRKLQSSIVNRYSSVSQYPHLMKTEKTLKRPRNSLFLYRGPLKIQEEIWSNVAIVLPAYNEEVSIADVISKTREYYPRVRMYVIDDGSTDSTGEIAQQNGAKVIRHRANQGVGAAINTGLRIAQVHGAKIIVTIDSDRQHNPKDIARLIFPIVKGYADVVIGSRFLELASSEKMPSSRRLGNKFLTVLTNFLSGAQCTDTQSGLRAFRSDAARKLRITRKGYSASSEIISNLAGKVRFCEIPICAIYDQRTIVKGTSISSGITIARDLILESFRKVNPIAVKPFTADVFYSSEAQFE